MTAREPEPGGSTDDAIWRDLVARLEEIPGEETDVVLPEGHPDRRPRHEAGPETGRHPDQDRAETGRADQWPPAGPGDVPHEPSSAERARAIFDGQPLPPSGPRDYAGPTEEDGFVPPEPPPLGAGEPLIVLAWIGAAGAPLALLLAAIFWRAAPLPAVLGVIAFFIASVCYLLFRLPAGDGNDDDDDNGAVI